MTALHRAHFSGFCSLVPHSARAHVAWAPSAFIFSAIPPALQQCQTSTLRSTLICENPHTCRGSTCSIKTWLDKPGRLEVSVERGLVDLWMSRFQPQKEVRKSRYPAFSPSFCRRVLAQLEPAPDCVPPRPSRLSAHHSPLATPAAIRQFNRVFPRRILHPHNVHHSYPRHSTLSHSSTSMPDIPTHPGPLPKPSALCNSSLPHSSSLLCPLTRCHLP